MEMVEEYYDHVNEFIFQNQQIMVLKNISMIS